MKRFHKPKNKLYGDNMKLECVLCGNEIDKNNSNYIEQLTTSNYKNAYYFSNDVKMQYQPLCDDEFDDPDGEILVFGKSLKESPVSFPFKQHIIYNTQADEDDGVSYEQMNNVCNIVYNSGKEKIGDLRLVKYHQIRMGSFSDENLEEIIKIVNKAWKKPAYFVLRKDGNKYNKHINIYINDSPVEFANKLKDHLGGLSIIG